MSSSSCNASQASLLKDNKDQKLLRALKGEVPADEPKKAFHAYIEDLSQEERDTLVNYINKEEGVLTYMSTTHISLAAATYKDLSKTFPTLL